MDIVNGLHIIITFKPRDFSYGDAYEVLPEIIKAFYKALGSTVNTISLTQKTPDASDLKICMFNRRLFALSSIAPNEDARKYHIHIFLYGVHQFNMEFTKWTKCVDRELRKLKSISSSGSPIRIDIVNDEIDCWIRKYDNCLGDDYQPLIKYITSSKSGNLMGYFKDRNNPKFTYHY
jgi:hypothetical protein